MITLRKSEERRHATNGGQETWRTFDGGNSSDPLQAGFRSLESFNEERLAPGASFEYHPRRDMEILTYVRKGALIQEDPSGGTIALEVGECRRSTARAGTLHRASNGSLTDPAQVFLCCILPDREDSALLSDQRRFSLAERRGVLRLLLSPDGRNASLRLRRDAKMYSSLLETGQHLIHELVAGRGAWLHVVHGSIRLIDHRLNAGDAASLVDEAAVSLTAREPSEILLFDLGN